MWAFGVIKSSLEQFWQRGLGNAAQAAFDMPCMFCQCLVGDQEEGEVINTICFRFNHLCP